MHEFRARRRVASAMAALVAGGAAVFSSTDLSAAASDGAACIGIDDDAARLSCYDRAHGRGSPAPPPVAAAPAPAAVTAAPAPPPVAAAPAPAAVTAAPAPAPSAAAAAAPASATANAAAEVNFGAENLQHEEAAPVAEVDELRATVTEVVAHPRGKHVVRLDNGQVWQQVEVSKTPPADVGDEVKLWRGWFDSYYLRRTAGGKTVNVRRVE